MLPFHVFRRWLPASQRTTPTTPDLENFGGNRLRFKPTLSLSLWRQLPLHPTYIFGFIYIYIYTLTYILIPTVHPLRSQRRRYKRGYYLLL